ncbi:ADP-ribosylglycohydrolase family protein [Streptomyces sp. NPDC091259]|uniref:ADP-ribosylglycohydrolase family protein n=1 Tax=Streptomyces sp. NPDC091259 TaxID=3365976 RepID=UPI00381450E9
MDRAEEPPDGLWVRLGGTAFGGPTDPYPAGPGRAGRQESGAQTQAPDTPSDPTRPEAPAPAATPAATRTAPQAETDSGTRPAHLPHTGPTDGPPPAGTRTRPDAPEVRAAARTATDTESRPGGVEDRAGGGAPGRTGTRTGGAGVSASAPVGTRGGGRRIEGLLLGLAAGDAAGWPAARHRASRMPEWTRRLTRELDTFAEQNATTTLPVPIALNQPPEPLRLGPSDDAEWAAFAAESVLTAAGVLLSDLSRSRRMRAAIDLAWNALASEVAAAAERAPEVESAVLPLRARISVRAGLGNLAAGLRPPATGHDNPHYFDDAACVRACVLAVVHPGDPRAAADLAEFDARYTQDGDGVHGARAMAAAVATALAGAGTDAAVDAALEQLPEATEIGRNARHAVKLARTDDGGGAFALVPLLEHQIVDHVYSYGIAAAETVPVALALVTAARGDVAEAVPAAACLSRVADSAPALAGALTGALGGGDCLPAAWREACRTLSGCALPHLAGTDLVELAALLACTELTSPKANATPTPQGMIRT